MQPTDVSVSSMNQAPAKPERSYVLRIELISNAAGLCALRVSESTGEMNSYAFNISRGEFAKARRSTISLLGVTADLIGSSHPSSLQPSGQNTSKKTVRFWMGLSSMKPTISRMQKLIAQSNSWVRTQAQQAALWLGLAYLGGLLALLSLTILPIFLLSCAFAALCLWIAERSSNAISRAGHALTVQRRKRVRK